VLAVGDAAVNALCALEASGAGMCTPQWLQTTMDKAAGLVGGLGWERWPSVALRAVRHRQANSKITTANSKNFMPCGPE
jgi:hypothetical protein